MHYQISMRLVKKQFTVLFFITLLLCFFPSVSVSARDLKASLAIIPNHAEIGPDGKPRGGFVDVVKAIDEVYTEGKISIELYPFPRSIANVITGNADFHIPLARFQNNELDKNISIYENIPAFLFDYADEKITDLVVIIYSNASKPPLELKNISKYDLAIISGNAIFYKMKLREIPTIESAIQMLLKGRIDGYIMEQDAVDDYIIKHKIKNIRRQLLSIKDSAIVIPKGEKGKEINRILNDCIRKLRKSGKLQKLIKNIHQPFHDWQPYETNWDKIKQ
jgi:polar amino acid transport system substrate-binding protein